MAEGDSPALRAASGHARSNLLRRGPRMLHWGIGGAVAIMAWFGWLAIAPTAGFPALAPAPMFNRVLRLSLGSRWGWVALVVALGVAAAAYAVALSARILPPGYRGGVLFGLGVWLLVGVVGMPLLALLTPDAPLALPRGGAFPGMATPADPEAMRPTFMMVHLGVLAAIGALIAWALFGLVLGAAGLIVGTTGEPSASPVRSFAVLAGFAAFVILVGGAWAVSRPADAAALSCGEPFGRRITGTVEGDVEVTTHGTICAIRGTVTGDVVVRDTTDDCTKREVLTAVHVIGGTIEGSIRAEGRRCVMVWLRDGARVGGDIDYGGRGNLGFLGDESGATVEGNVLVRSGQLWATGDSTRNRVGGDLVCDGASAAGGAGAGSDGDWDGMGDGADGTVAGEYRGC